MRFHRRFHRSLRRLVIAGAVAGTVWVPAAAASHVVQIGGQLVPASHVSSWQANAGQPSGTSDQLGRYTESGDVYTGGTRIRMPSTGYSRIIGTVGIAARASAVQSASASTASTGNGFDWRDTGIGIASAFAACVVLAGAYMVRRRIRLTPA